MQQSIQQQIWTLLIVVLNLILQQEHCVADIAYSANFDGGTVSRIEENGNVSAFASGLSRPSGIVVDPNGNVFVSSAVDGTVRKFSSAGSDLGVFAHVTDGNGNSRGINGLAIDGIGNMYVGESSIVGGVTNGNIHKFSSNGSDLGVFAHLEFNSFPAFGPATYFAMSFDHSGNLWATDEFFGRVYEFSPVGTNLLFPEVPSGAFGLAIAQNGDVYVGRDGIEKYSSTGNDLGSIALLPANVTGLAFDSKGTLFASLYETGEIHRFSQDGTDLGVFASGLVGPFGLAFAPVSAVPEASSITLLGIGVIAFTIRVVRRRNRCRRSK